MADRVASHYSDNRKLADAIAQSLRSADKDLNKLTTMDLATVDEFHIPNGIFAVYDVLQGEGGEVLYPVPWAREPSISHVVTPDDMKSLLVGGGFKLLEVLDSTEESQAFFERMTAQMAKTGSPPVAWRLFLGDDFLAMARNQVRNVTERRIRTVSFICVA